MHDQVLHLLLDHDDSHVSLARLVHHAAEANDAELVLRLAPEAARQAAAQGSHREAVAHYRSALEYADVLSAEQQAELLDALSNECYLHGRMEQAVQAQQTALSLWRGLKRTEKIGNTLCELSNIFAFMARHEEAMHSAMEAVELLETLPPSRELARSYQHLASLFMGDSDTANTMLWATRALELAEQLGDAGTVCSVLNDLGSTEMDELPGRGRDKLEQRRLSMKHATWHWRLVKCNSSLQSRQRGRSGAGCKEILKGVWPRLHPALRWRSRPTVPGTGEKWRFGCGLAEGCMKCQSGHLSHSPCRWQATGATQQPFGSRLAAPTSRGSLSWTAMKRQSVLRWTSSSGWEPGRRRR